MTQPEPTPIANVEEHVPEDLDEWLDGPEPAWDDEPETLPFDDKGRANALLRRLRAVRLRRADDLAHARHQIDQTAAWATGRRAIHDRQEAWLTATLERYHRAVLLVAPKQLTVPLTDGELTSKMGRPTWHHPEPLNPETEDEDAVAAAAAAVKAFEEWVVPPHVAQAIADARAGYEAAVTAILVGNLGPDRAPTVRVPGPKPPEVADGKLHDYLTRRDEKGKAIGWGIDPNGEAPPGLKVDPPEREFTPKPHTDDPGTTGEDDPDA